MTAAGRFILPSEERPEDFLTVVDVNGASVNLERDYPADDVTSVWIARPGENDGYSVLLTADDRLKMATFLLRGLS